MLLFINFISFSNYFFANSATNLYTHMNKTYPSLQGHEPALSLYFFKQPINKKPRNSLRGLCYIELVFSTYSSA
ncbi:hypothetical protein A3860_00725 [Niastella vici]|uniref:Uncharacterized protein n=1 Tax=Niastella vici TaxID=1703345 RepID=A0A1V9G8L5_9BACT|nr:hypothetical protein A3860_00725 [Niastella vici]